MIRAFIQLGSNTGERKIFLDSARLRIQLLAGRATAASSVYETQPWGNANQPAFLNQVVAIETMLDPGLLLTTMQAIENSLGRVRTGKWAPRTIDLDLLLYGDQVINEVNLVVPHLAMAERRFVLVPLDEIASSVVHPVLEKTIGTLLKECPDQLGVAKLEIKG